MTPEQRRMRAQTAALTRWAYEPDRAKATRPALNGMLAKFERQVDPDGTLPPEERQTRAEALRRAHMRSLALKSSQTRAARKAAGRRGRAA
jgi:hypothetical protein